LAAIEPDQRWSYAFDAAMMLESFGERVGRNDALESAIAFYRLALADAPRERAPLDWAKIQVHLAKTLITLGGRHEETAHLTEAVNILRTILPERDSTQKPTSETRDSEHPSRFGSISRSIKRFLLKRAPERNTPDCELSEVLERGTPDWELAQLSLGNALLILGIRTAKRENLQAAAQAYAVLVQMHSAEDMSLGWARAASGMGYALSELGKREIDMSFFVAAERTYRIALVVQLLKAHPREAAGTLTNLADVVLRLGEQENSKERFEEALALNRQALERRPRTQVPFEWAESQSNLGAILYRLGREEEAVAAFRAALEEIDYEHSRISWAKLHLNLGGALATLGHDMYSSDNVEDGLSRLKESIISSNKALRLINQTQMPEEWATIQVNLGLAYSFLGYELRDTAYLRRSIDAYRGALSERAPERVPIDWAKTQLGLGMALVFLGEITREAIHIKQGIEAYNRVIALAKTSGHLFLLTSTEPLLTLANESLVAMSSRS
jgi:tetratricopeptide (TPR) repeat protein